MEDWDASVRELRQQLDQLDIEARGSALTPGEARKNADQREAVAAELRKLGAADLQTGASIPDQPR